jgi:hypothetical protein
MRIKSWNKRLKNWSFLIKITNSDRCKPKVPLSKSIKRRNKSKIHMMHYKKSIKAWKINWYKFKMNFQNIEKIMKNRI